MFALVAAVILWLAAADIISDSHTVFLIALGFFFIHFFWNPWPVTYVVGNRGRRE
jgi:hypothetical protein